MIKTVPIKLVLTQAVEATIQDFTRLNKPFSSYDIVKALRDKVNRRELIVIDVTKEKGIYKIERTKVRAIIKEAFKSNQEFKTKYRAVTVQGEDTKGKNVTYIQFKLITLKPQRVQFIDL